MKRSVLWLVPLLLCTAMFVGTAAAGPHVPGNFYAGDGNLFEFDSNGISQTTFAGATALTDLAFSPVTGNIWAACPTSNRLYRVNAATGIVSNVPNFLFNQPTALAFTPTGKLYVLNQGANSIYQVVVETGMPTTVVNTTIGIGHLTSPTSMVFGAGTNPSLYVTSGTNNIVRFNSLMAYQNTLTVPGLLTPGGMTVADSGNIFVVSKGTNTVLEVNPQTGAVVKVFGGGTLNPLVDARDVAIGVSNNLLVADASQGIVEFNLTTGAYIGTLPTGGMTAIVAVAPEPATLVLAGLGLGALILRRRRR